MKKDVKIVPFPQGQNLTALKSLKRKVQLRKKKKKKNRLKNKKATYYIDITVCQYTPQYASSYCGDFTHHFRILVISINHYFTFSV